MSSQVLLHLPPHILDTAKTWANLVGQPVDVFLAEALKSTMSPLAEAAPIDHLNQLSDQEILDASNAQLPPHIDDRLRQLLKVNNPTR